MEKFTLEICTEKHRGFVFYNPHIDNVIECSQCHKKVSLMYGVWNCVHCWSVYCRQCRNYPVAPACPLVSYLYSTRCEEGHMLVWSTDSSKYKFGMYKCDLCQSINNLISEGRWYCKSCGYNICPYCRDKTIDLKSVGEEPEPEINTPECLYCSKGHLLKWEADNVNEDNLFICDVCKTNNCLLCIGRWTCKYCHYNVCQQCRRPKVVKCPSGHILSLSFRLRQYRDYKFKKWYRCDKCECDGNPKLGRYTCPCQYNLCPKCLQFHHLI